MLAKVAENVVCSDFKESVSMSRGLYNFKFVSSFEYLVHFKSVHKAGNI